MKYGVTTAMGTPYTYTDDLGRCEGQGCSVQGLMGRLHCPIPPPDEPQYQFYTLYVVVIDFPPPSPQWPPIPLLYRRSLPVPHHLRGCLICSPRDKTRIATWCQDWGPCGSQTSVATPSYLAHDPAPRATHPITGPLQRKKRQLVGRIVYTSF